jgi:hypothetical protein
MCPTGGASESAFFLGNKKYDEKDVGEKAVEFLMSIAEKEGWQNVGKSFVGDDQFFSPNRVFLISIDPIVVIAIPWEYKTKPNSPFALHDLFVEGEKFSEADYRQSSLSYIPLYWGKNLRIPVEIRRSLPAGTVQARVITSDYDSPVVIPLGSGKGSTVELGAYRLLFDRAPDGKVLTSVEPTKH